MLRAQLRFGDIDILKALRKPLSYYAELYPTQRAEEARRQAKAAKKKGK